MWMNGLLLITLLTQPTPRPAASPREAREPQTARSFGSVAVDTIFPVKAGQRLLVDTFSGDVTVRSWSRDAVRLTATHSRRTRVEIVSSSSEVQISSHGRMGPGSAQFDIAIPQWMPISVQGVHTDISIEGSKGEVKAQTVHGDVQVLGGGNFVSLSSVDGLVKVVGARGRVQASSVNDEVELSEIVGDITAESVNGNVILVRPDSKSIEASTINGGVLFDGETKTGGVYSLSTHNGAIMVGLPDKPDVAVSVSTFGGNFSTFLPIQVTETRRHKPISFVLGSGDAQLELESFQGSIRLEKLVTVQRAWQRLLEHDDDQSPEAATARRKREEKREEKRQILRERLQEKIEQERERRDAEKEAKESNPEENR
jgi:hypothetical protein